MITDVLPLSVFGAAVYLLINDDSQNPTEVVYVGMSRHNAFSRISAHIKRGIQFTSYRIIPCHPPSYASRLEIALIQMYAPRHNVKSNPFRPAGWDGLGKGQRAFVDSVIGKDTAIQMMKQPRPRSAA